MEVKSSIKTLFQTINISNLVLSYDLATINYAELKIAPTRKRHSMVVATLALIGSFKANLKTPYSNLLFRLTILNNRVGNIAGAPSPVKVARTGRWDETRAMSTTAGSTWEIMVGVSPSRTVADCMSALSMSSKFRKRCRHVLACINVRLMLIFLIFGRGFLGGIVGLTSWTSNVDQCPAILPIPFFKLLSIGWI